VPGTWHLGPDGWHLFLASAKGKKVWKGCGNGMYIKTSGTGVKVQIG
jgi:hypothetical protein